MKKIVFLLFSLSSLSVLAQDTISKEMVASYTYTFSVDSHQLSGEGANVLKREFAKAQYVLLGETHDMAEIAQFTKIIIPILKKQGFNFFISEHGNNGLQRLLQLIESEAEIEKALQSIYQAELARTGHLPMPFLKGEEDVQFLKTSLENEMMLLGIDQEYFYSFPFLFDALLDLSDGSAKIIAAHKKAMAFTISEYKKLAAQKDYPFCTKLKNSREIEIFFNSLDTSDLRIQNIINDLKLSWTIYGLNQINPRQSFVERGALMRRQFSKLHDQLSLENYEEPKILIKMGALHTMRGKTPLGIFDIGDLVSKQAKLEGSKDLNLLFMFRYYKDAEEELGYFDNAEGESDWLVQRKAFMLQGQVEQWTLIDLRGLEKALKNNKVFVYPPLASIIEGHDYVIIPPAASDVKPLME